MLPIQGEELGMTDVCVTVDSATKEFLRCEDPSLIPFAREFCRSPFQWDDSANAGFSNGSKTWLPLSESYESVNLAAQLATNGSHVDIYKKLMKIRKSEAGVDGALVIQALNDQILVIKRELADKSKKSLVAIFNFGSLYTHLGFINETSQPTKVNIQISRLNSFHKIGSEIGFKEIRLAPYDLLVATYNSAASLTFNFILLFVTLMLQF